jgi:hypothetical protein
VRIQFFLPVFLINAAIAIAAELQEVVSFPDKQITGVGVSTRSGRIFVNFPNWSGDHSISVAEIVNGQPKTFPNDEWNKPGPASSHFICVQSRERQLSTMLSAAPVRQSDQGANVKIETATALMTTVARTTRRRPPSSEISRAFVLIMGSEVAKAATRVAFFKIILSLDACRHAPT